jgi:hypothetical protein
MTNVERRVKEKSFYREKLGATKFRRKSFDRLSCETATADIGSFTLATFVGVTVSDSDTRQCTRRVTVLALHGTTQVGSFLFLSFGQSK